MPRTARVLQFRARPATFLSAAEASELAADFTATPRAERRDEEWSRLENPEFVQALIVELNKQVNRAPRETHQTSQVAYSRIRENSEFGVFDERDYALGEFALIAGNACRLLGRFDEADDWFDLAEASFRRTVNAGPSLTRVAHARLVVRYQLRKYSHVLGLLPHILADYRDHGMVMEWRKARYLEASVRKDAGQADESLQVFLELATSLGDEEPVLKALSLTAIAEEYARRDQESDALSFYAQAVEAVDRSGDVVAAAHLKASVGEVYRAKAAYGPAVDCFRSAVAGYHSLGMEAQAAYLRIVLAECLLSASRDREAEWEILAALPTIESQKMLAEGLAAVSMLRESVGRRKTDRSALKIISDHLKAAI